MIVGRPLPNKIHPRNTVDAQFSAYYQLAVAWLDGNETGWGVYDRIDDKDISELLNNITVDAAEDLHGLAGRLEMHWEDGSTTIDTEKDPIGEISNPFTDEQLLQKLMSLAEPVYGNQKSKQIAELITKIDQWKNTKELMSLLA
jgi:2-methylcitrate dehydratase PrpD